MHLLNVKTKVLAVDFRPKNPDNRIGLQALKFTIYINLNIGSFPKQCRSVQ